MATKLIAVLLVLLVARVLPQAESLRNFSWFRTWLDGLLGSLPSAVALALALGVPFLLCALVQWTVHGTFFGLTSFLFAAAVLYYSSGPRDLERDVEAIIKASDSEQRASAAQALREEHGSEPIASDCTSLVVAVFRTALKRGFGVVFWFVVLGPAGALLYRLAQLPGCTSQQAQSKPARVFAALLDWLPAHLMALALALASNFDAVFTTWRDYHRNHPQGYAGLQPGFLDAIARASVAADVAAEGEEDGSNSPVVALEDAMVLIRRVFVVWLMLVALIVLGGWFG